LGASFADVSVAADYRSLAGDHDVSGTAQAVRQGVLAAVQIVELRLGDRVVDVDGREEEFVLLGHDVEAVDTGGGFLRDADTTGSDLGVFLGVLGKLTSDESKDDLELSVIGGFGVGKDASLGVDLLGLNTFVNEKGQISSVVYDDITAISLVVFRLGDAVQGAFPIFL
jgi:hypothetical protein